MDQGVFGEACNLDGGARRGSCGEIFRVDFIHRAEVVHVLEEHGGLNDAVKIAAACLQDGLYVFHDPFGLLTDIAAEKFIGARVERDLARGKQKAAGFDGLRVRTDGFGSFVGKNDVFHCVAS